MLAAVTNFVHYTNNDKIEMFLNKSLFEELLIPWLLLLLLLLLQLPILFLRLEQLSIHL